MTDTRAIGQHFDSADDLFNWLNNAIFGVAAVKLANQSGVTARLLAGPATAADLAALALVPEERLVRVLDFLVGHGLIERTSDGQFCANARTAMMDEAAAYLEHTAVSHAAATQLLPALREGRPAFELRYGAPVFEHFAAHPEMAANFARFMGFMTRRVERFLFSQHRFRPFATVADIGGSMGDLLLATLREYPGTNGILFDRPDVVDLARPAIAASPLAARVELVGGSFFDHVPAADLYMLKQILHDWDDHEAGEILHCIRAAMPAHARVVVIDHVVSDTPEPDESLSTDIAMMVWDTGRERKLGEFSALFARAGFEIDRLTRNPNGHSVIEIVLA